MDVAARNVCAKWPIYLARCLVIAGGHSFWGRALSLDAEKVQL